ncbi:fluoride efflux transporter CrcB [Bacillus sp. REN3]|uniref:fluoride efflux transporter CrcB n=1 Tax=Bacillus sp. REN3 TaxID=2802440 RepID=UPI001AEE92E3|nr:fluoride efflux transporter CrcB [Bacillus sp. REN3]
MIYLGVGLGGMLGSLLRFYLGYYTFHLLNTSFPLGTFLANLTGSLILGWFTSRVIEQKKMNETIASGIGKGLLGSFTTFSAFSLESFELLEAGRYETAFLYILLSSGGGLLLAAAGYSFGMKSSKAGEEAV